VPHVLNLAYRLLQNGQRIVPGDLFNTAALMAPKIAKEYGLQGVQFFPMTVSQSGTASNGDGYGKQFDGKISPTRFAPNDAAVLRGIACLHACGLVAVSDEDTHQYDGGNWTKGAITYPEYGEGGLGTGDFNKYPWGFVGAPPLSPVDPVFDSNGNFGFGDMTSLIMSGHDGYMLAGMVRTMVRRARYADWDMWRHDDAKGTAVEASNAFISALNKYGKGGGYAEVFVGNISELQYWLSQTGWRMGLLDFPLHWTLANACNSFNANALAPQALCNTNPDQAWKFRDNGDTDENPGESVVSNGLIANARLLTAPGDNTLMYAKDYLPYSAGGYNLSELLITYVWIARNLAFGDEIQRWGGDGSVAAFERLGYPGLLTVYNFDTYNNRELNGLQTNFGPNVELWDYSGTLQRRFGYSSVWTDGNGRLNLKVPCNANAAGDNTLCLSRTGYTAPFEAAPARTTTNVFEGAKNTLIPRASASGSTIGKIWCDVDTHIGIEKFSGDGVRFKVTDAKGNVVIDRVWEGKVKERGYHTIEAIAPSNELTGFEAAVTYMATKGITEADLAAENTPAYDEYSARAEERTEARLTSRRRSILKGISS
jgi:hypothetical protein